jgi:hypothetical protein
LGLKSDWGFDKSVLLQGNHSTHQHNHSKFSNGAVTAVIAHRETGKIITLHGTEKMDDGEFGDVLVPEIEDSITESNLEQQMTDGKIKTKTKQAKVVFGKFTTVSDSAASTVRATGDEIIHNNVEA